MAFVKLDTGVLDSTLWVDRPCREVFITALLMAEPIELDRELPQFSVRAIEQTGFVVPPGWYGFVRAAGVGIVNRALVDQETGLAALERLGGPDPESRSKEFDGRRLVRVDGGYIVLNYFKYRDRDHTAAERQRRLRERKRNAVTLRDSAVTSRIADADADADADAKTKSQRRATRIPADFSLTEDLRSFAVSQGLNPDTTLQAFRDYWAAASKGTKLDWAATWRTWCRNEYKRKPNSVTPSPNSVTTHEERVRRDFDELIARREAIGLGDFRLPNKGETVTQYRAAQDSEWTARREKMKAVQRAISG